MNKKIISAVILGIIIVFSLSFISQTRAQEGTIIIEAPKIYVDKVFIDPVKEDAKKITGKFTILSQEDKNYFDIYYEVNLFNAVQKSLTLDVGEIYNPENLRPVASEPNQDPLIIKPQETKEISYSFNIPENHPSGIYIIGIKLYQKDIILLSERKSAIFQLNGNNKFIDIDTAKAFIIRDGGSYPPDIGVDFAQDEIPVFSMVSQNLSSSDVSIYPKVTVYDRDQFGNIIYESKGETISLKGGEIKNLEFNLQETKKAGSFLARVQFIDVKDDKSISTSAYFRFVARGESGKILEILPDKLSYNKGDMMKIGVHIVGPADIFIYDENGILIRNPDRLDPSTANLKISVINVEKNKVVQEDSQVVQLSADSQYATLEFKLEKNLYSYKIITALEKDGEILDEKIIESINPRPQEDKIMDILKIILIILAAVSILAFLISRLKKNVSTIPMLIIILVVFAGVLMGSKAEAQSYTINWAFPRNGEVFNFDYCGSSNWWLTTTVGLVVNTCSNNFLNVKAEWRIDGSLVDTVWRYNLARGVQTGGLASRVINGSIVNGINAYYYSSGYRRPGNHTIGLDISIYDADSSNLIGTWSQTRSYSVRGYRNMYGYVRDQSGNPINLAILSLAGFGTTNSNSGGHYCFSRDYTSSIFNSAGYGMTVSKSGYQTVNDNPIFGSRQGLLRGDYTLQPNAPPPPPPPLPSCILTFSPSSITPGQSSTATWSSSNDADGNIPFSCTGDIGSGLLGTPSGSTTVSPAQTQTCTLTVQNSSGTRTCSRTITVGQPAPTCDSRYWSPSSTNVGGSSRFYWYSSDATSATLSCSGPIPLGSTSVSVDGNRLFSNFSSTGTETCVINLRGPGGSGNCSRSITVTSPANIPPTATIDQPAGNPSITEGDSVSFVGYGTDTDGTITAYQWRQNNCTTGTLLDSSTSFTRTFSTQGTYNIYFRVQDDDGAWSGCDSRMITVDPPCTSLSFISGLVSPSSVDVGGSYTVECDYGAIVDSINPEVGSGSCIWIDFFGTTANFDCIAGSVPGTFSNSCKLIEGTSSNTCAQTDAIDSLIVTVSGAQIIVHKIVCDSESDLPNWGGILGDPIITSSTAQDFIDSNSNCRFENGWEFQWADSSISNPGDHIGEAGSPWTTFGPTDSNGMASTIISNLLPSTKWIREVFKDGYFPFSGDNSDNPVSAEMVCHRDNYNYDNYDRIIGILKGETYYCIAFNVLLGEPEPICGDGIVEGSEECDDGANNGIVCSPPYGGSCNYCSITCTTINLTGSYCGDGTTDVADGEECDDGNNTSGDGCSATCRIEIIPPTSFELQSSGSIHATIVVSSADSSKTDITVYVDPAETFDKMINLSVTSIISTDGLTILSPALGEFSDSNIRRIDWHPGDISEFYVRDIPADTVSEAEPEKTFNVVIHGESTSGITDDVTIILNVELFDPDIIEN